MFKRFHKNRYGYSRWDGTQNIEGLDADDILNAMADDYMEDGNLQQALKRLMQDGIRSEDGRKTMGLRELMERMRNMRNEQLNRYNMASGVMDDLREKLEEIKSLEREGIQQRLDGNNESSQPSQASDQQQPSDQPQGTNQAQGGSGQESQPASSSSQSGQSGES
ncbi:MAG: VWA domain-containing protein, partial [Ktedonobacteraceae bacterium]